MKNEAKGLYGSTKKCYMLLIRELEKLKDSMKGEDNESELADTSLALRECEKLVESLRKDITKQLNLNKKSACLIWTQKQLTEPNGEPIRTEYCTATPDIKMVSSIPSKASKEGFLPLMQWLDIPPWVYERELVRPHYPSFVELCTELTRNGKDLPPGVDPSKLSPAHDLLIRKTKKPITEG